MRALWWLLNRLRPARVFPAVGDVWSGPMGQGWAQRRVVGVSPSSVSLHDGLAVVAWPREAFEDASLRWELVRRGLPGGGEYGR